MISTNEKWLAALIVLVIFATTPAAALSETVLDSGITMGIGIEYMLNTPDTSVVTVTYTFKNPENERRELEYSGSFFTRKPGRIIRVYDTPQGAMEYNVIQEDRAVQFSFGRSFVPYETYQIKIEFEILDVTDLTEHGWLFKDEQKNSFEWPIEDYRVSMTLPKGRFTVYDIQRLDPGAAISERGKRKTISWETPIIQPGEEYISIVEFISKPDMAALSQLIAAIVVVVLLGYILYTYGRGSFLFPMGFVKTIPKKGPTGKSDVIAAIEKMFHEAEHEVLITSPWIFYVDWFTSNVKQLTDQGVKVRIVTHSPYERKKVGDKWKVSENRRQSFALSRFLDMFPPGTVRLNENLHSKMVVVDGKKVLFSSANLTQSGLWENYEAGMWIENEHITRKAVDYFEKIWSDVQSHDLTRKFITG